MAHMVKCLYCQERFDADKIKHQKIGRRYAHLNCHEPRIDVDGAIFNEIIHYVGFILGDAANYKKIANQIKDYYINKGISYKDIYLTLKYWYDIKHNDTSKSGGGIGIVPFIYKEAKDYWKSFDVKKIPKLDTEEIILKKRKKEKTLLERMLEE